MARLEFVQHKEQRCDVIKGEVIYEDLRVIHALGKIPQIFWSDRNPWQEVNLWACQRATSRDVELPTIEANLRGLVHYANYLETNKLQWFEFPSKKADRCLVKYRGFLKAAMKSNDLSPSTASTRMRHVIAFYRWVQGEGLFQPDVKLWRDIPVFIKYFDSVGFERTLRKITTDLSIPNRRRPGERLEDGLLPVAESDRDAILAFVRTRGTPELFLFLSAGFFTGMRLGTLCDLKIKTLEHAVPDPASPEIYRLAVGPGASPSVNTKFGVTGQIFITSVLLESLKEYAYSPRRLQREAAALPEHRDLLFLTRYGNPYGRKHSDKSSPLNVELSVLRKAGVAYGLESFRNFHFHQSRCTFATELAKMAIRVGDEISAIAFVCEALLHKDEATTFKYIKFAKSTPIKKEVANAFTAAFLGAKHGSGNLSHG